MNTFRIFLVSLLLLLGSPANAATYAYSGEVTAGSGGLSSLIPVGALITGTIELASPGANQTSTDTSIFLSANILMTNSTGGVLFCFNFNTACAPGQTEVPIIEVTDLNLTFNSVDFPSAGSISLLPLSPTFNLEIPLFLNITDGTFLAEAAGLGMVSGVGNFQMAPVPLPGAVWFMLSSLLGLTALKRKRIN